MSETQKYTLSDAAKAMMEVLLQPVASERSDIGPKYNAALDVLRYMYSQDTVLQGVENREKRGQELF